MYRSVGDDPVLNIQPNTPAAAPAASTASYRCNDITMQRLNQNVIAWMAGCFTATRPAGMSEANFSRLCAEAAYCNWYARAGTTDVPAALRKLYPLPACFNEAQLAGQTYCSQYGYQGPDPTSNALCWVAGRSAAYWNAFLAVPPCTAAGPSPAPTPGPSVMTTATPSLPPSGPSTPSAPVAASNTMLYVAGGLGLLAVGAVAIAIARKKK